MGGAVVGDISEDEEDEVTTVFRGGAQTENVNQEQRDLDVGIIPTLNNGIEPRSRIDGRDYNMSLGNLFKYSNAVNAQSLQNVRMRQQNVDTVDVGPSRGPISMTASQIKNVQTRTFNLLMNFWAGRTHQEYLLQQENQVHPQLDREGKAKPVNSEINIQPQEPDEENNEVEAPFVSVPNMMYIREHDVHDEK